MEIKLSENIKRFRTNRNLTQKELAVLLSVSPQAVSRWEKGLAYPDTEMLPALARHLGVSIDTLMNSEGNITEELKRELWSRLDKAESENFDEENSLRILEICEKLAEKDTFHLRKYFRLLFSSEHSNALSPQLLSEKKSKARDMMRACMASSNRMATRVTLLQTVMDYEDEDTLYFWTDDVQFPIGTKANLFDELLLRRYSVRGEYDNFQKQNAKCLRREILNTLSYLTKSALSDLRHKKYIPIHSPSDFEKAREMLALYSERIDDIFLFERIMLEDGYAKALFREERIEEGLSALVRATEYLSVLTSLADEETTLYGSIEALKSESLLITKEIIMHHCIMNLGVFTKLSVYGSIKDDRRLLAYEDAIAAFFPDVPSRCFVDGDGDEEFDASFAALLTRAQKFADAISKNEQVIFFQMTGGYIDGIRLNMNDSLSKDYCLKQLIQRRIRYGGNIERIVCLWHNGGLDLPSFAFREALLELDPIHGESLILLQGWNKFVIKRLNKTMR